jgi:biopolymer transport protein TolR
MASIMPSSSGKGRRNLDAPINLVPYIDLMITMIAFLMMTAIWTQVSTLELQNATNSSPVEKDPKVKPLGIEMSADGFTVVQEGKARIMIPKKNGSYDDEALYNNLKQWKAKDPLRHQVDVLAEDGILYESIAKVIDSAAGLKLNDVTLRPLEN